jgi:hypothetical protein
MHPLLNLVATRPQLLAEHAQGYAELLADEWPRAASSWKRQAWLNTLALLSLFAATILTGLALMLWAALPGATMTAAWVLVLVPLLPLCAALACFIAARAGARGPNELQRQLRADMTLLRAVAAAG